MISLTKGAFTVVEKEGVKVAEVKKSDDVALECTLQDLTVEQPATLEKVLAKLEKYGGCIVKNYLPLETVDRILADVEEYIDQDKDFEGTFLPRQTRTVPGMCKKSAVTTEEFVCHPLNLAVSDALLGKENCFWIGDEVVTGYSAPQHNSCITFKIGPGAPDQVLHRDDMLHHNIRKHMDVYEYGTETALGSVLALSNTSKANGATRFVPGSHLWSHMRKPTASEAVYAEMSKGDCFFMLASCYHGGSANTTEDEYRTQVILFMTQGILRQEENIMVGTPVEYFKSLSVTALKTLGLSLSYPFLGMVDGYDGLRTFKPEHYEKRKNDDPYTSVYPGVLV
ncbi:unnamed protein product [Kuraishia capsulata CBS 1993]|uniref:Phytanoyl-CoA dioxygenase n=1 Tax=Kuraishia capsulata CBS 1993 TaxID=1382522 RepID=W6MWZ6_9ASCO|nr:uncharacterized protein KUCA_T00004010001 [Kuraishia capsulata CBS 1993]CDK28030.1 unnamed protein product [Kuraishia capsulata CBS 1993]